MKNTSSLELSHSAKCLIDTVRWNQSACCQMAVHTHCCSALMKSRWTPCGLTLHPEQYKDSRAELCHSVLLTVGGILDEGPEASNWELSQMFLSENVQQEVRPEHRKFWSKDGLGNMNLRPTHEGVAGGETFIRSPIINRIPLLHWWTMVALMVGGSMMQTSIGKLGQDSGRAEVKMLSQEVVPPFRVCQAAVVGVHTSWPLVSGTTWRIWKTVRIFIKSLRFLKYVTYTWIDFYSWTTVTLPDYFADLWRLQLGQSSTCYLSEAVSQLDLGNGKAEDQWPLPCPLHFLYPNDKDLSGQMNGLD